VFATPKRTSAAAQEISFTEQFFRVGFLAPSIESNHWGANLCDWVKWLAVHAKREEKIVECFYRVVDRHPSAGSRWKVQNRRPLVGSTVSNTGRNPNR
jgi:hypothetical protein